MMKVLFRRMCWYNPGDVISDLIAGITVGLVTIPQSFMFAAAAGVPVQYAIYSALLGSLLYPILGRNKDVIVSSTVLLRELIRLYVTDGLNWFPQKAVMMTFVSGVCILLAAILSAGSLINCLSSYVLAGLVWASVLSLVTTQLHHMLGIPYRPQETAPVLSLLKNMHEANPWDTALSSCCIVILLFLAALKSLRLSPVDKEPGTFHRIAEKLFFFMGNVSGAAILVTATAVAYQLSGFTLLAGATNFEPEFPSVIAPPFSTIRYPNSDWRVTILVPFMVPVISVLAHAAVLRAFSGPEGIITGWELSSLGIINMLGSCFSCAPLGADFARSSINCFYGARTRLAGIISGLIVALYLTGAMAAYYSFIPRAAVASVTLFALVHLARGITVVALQERIQGRMLSGLATFVIGVFFSLEYGVLVGIILDLTICALLFQREPVLAEKLQSCIGSSYILVTPSREVKLPTVEMFEESIARNEVLNDQSVKHMPVVIDCRHISLANLNTAHGVYLLIDFFRNKKTPVIFHNLNADVAKAFSTIFPPDFLHTASEGQLRKLFIALKVQSQNSNLNVIGCDVELQRQGATTSDGTSC